MFLQEYEKIRQLGRGAFASVYKVRHSKLGYIRALKVCNNFIEDENDKAWQTFVSECRVLLRIGNGSHPNIVRIYQPRLLDNRAVVEMDCVEGEPLCNYIRDNRFIPIDEFYRFVGQFYYPLKYPIGRIMMYAILAIGMTFAGLFITDKIHPVIGWMSKIFFLIFYVFIVLRKEKLPIPSKLR